jgi:hypothetical protein
MLTKRLSLLPPLKLARIFLALCIFEGVAVLLAFFRVHSEAGSAVWGGYSLLRLLTGSALLILEAGWIAIWIGTIGPSGWLISAGRFLSRYLHNEAVEVLLRTAAVLILVSALGALLVYVFPAVQRIFPFLQGISPIQLAVVQAGVFIVWASLLMVKLLLLIAVYSKPKHERRLSFPAKAALSFWTAAAFLVLVVVFFQVFKQPYTVQRLMGLFWKVLFLSAWFSAWAILKKKTGWPERFPLLFEGSSVWLCVFLASIQAGQWLGIVFTPKDNYFNLLAEAFLHGRLYLIDPPTTFDLTFSNGNWYVAPPPFPAIVLLPFIAIAGVEHVNTVVFSVALAATAALFVYITLVEMAELGWIKLPRPGMVWLVALFSLGSVEWWLSITGRVWHFSQICTVLFSCLAFWSVVRKQPAWVGGLFLAAAVLSRPNAVLLWPALLFIQIQHNHDEYRPFDWKRAIRWGMASAVPLVLAVGLLLVYNRLRFGSFMDFGYTTINGSEYTVDRAQTYGIFNPHFIPFNLYWMFVGLDGKLIPQCGYYLTRGLGMSIFLTSPALVYLFRKFKITWWTVGCWLSILLSVALLAMYHNNGANQYGYRYVMDFFMPIVLLIAFSAGKRVSFPLKLLIVLSVLINYYGIISWFRGPC